MTSSPAAAVDSRAGWPVVAGTHVVTGVTFGSSYAFSALFPGLAAEFGASRGATALVFSLSAFVFYSLGAVAGPLGDRLPTRVLVLSGLVAMVLGYVGAANAHSLAAVYLFYAAGAGLGIGLSYVPALGAVQSWFARRRAQASGIALAGLGVGTLVLPMLTARLMPELGWRGGLMMLAGAVALFGVPAATLLHRRTHLPDPNTPALAAPGARDLWRDARFRRFYLSLVLASFCSFIAYVHIVPASQDLGLPLETGTLLVGLIGAGSVAGRFVLTGLGDRLGALRLLVLLTFAVAACFLIWAMATSFAALAVFAVLFGVSYGGCVGLYPVVASEVFGARHIGAVLGHLYTAVGISALVGPTLAGLVFDRTGSYLAPILVSAACAGVAAVLAMGLADRAEA
ncbi:MFS transporter [Ancylobacter sp. 6x-1]|uniref:MFS transporter n=1 Tax=Ancylobacter crimeensis TaxID=2579147 RepID=A0ABT0DES3_9HYPH|nr:MFS transporter [Ancylobacter crimeensis]MCK0198465.1 MFS transporter [Ancylobacter crimeensis]